MRLLWRLGLALLILPGLMGATIYRWVDDHGVVNYAQIEPRGVDAERVDSATGAEQSASPAPASKAAAAPADKPQYSDAQKKMLADLRAAESAREDKVAQIREANCKQAKDLLAKLTSNGRIRVRGDDGAEHVMPEEERRQRIDTAQQAVVQSCATTASR